MSEQEQLTGATAPTTQPATTGPAVSAATAEAVNQPHITRTQPAPRGSNAVAWLAMMLALAAAGAGGYVIFNQEQLIANWRGKQAELNADVKTLSSQTEQQADQSSSLQQQIGQLSDQVQATENNTHRLLAITGDPGRHWQLIEAEFLLRNASYRLQLSQDVIGAIASLQDADKQLERHGDPALLPLRQTIAQQIVTLQALTLPDVAGLSANISALLASVDKLTIPSALKGVGGATAATQTAEPAWQASLNKLWEQIKSLVVVRHGEKAEAPLMPPDQHYFLYMNLQLKLETARLALLQGNEQVWHDSLSQANKWLQTYFDVNTQGVRSARETLSQLDGVTIRPPLPDISSALLLLREYKMKHPGIPAPAPMPTTLPELKAPASPGTTTEGGSL